MNFPGKVQCDRRPVLYVKMQSDSHHLGKEIADKGWEVDEVGSIYDAKKHVQGRDYKVGVVHLEDYCHDEITALESLLNQQRLMQWIILTKPDCLQESSVCKLIQDGCYDYFTLPLTNGSVKGLMSALGHAYGMAALTVKDLNDQIDEYEMVGVSKPMLTVFKSIRKVAGVDAPVLINGESGTGKELIARAIHERSRRAKGPFITVNCGALPENLIQSELFGHEKGSFTGAHQCKIGQIEAAGGGTLFLDEIGDLPMSQQVNLLRFLQEQVIQRVGSNEEIPVDVRVLSATHVDLENAVQEGNFREDLYYRLNVLQLKPPALRERAGDIELLARFFFTHFQSEGGIKVKGFSRTALQALENYTWPGNVRELINRVRRAVVMCEGRLIMPDDLGLIVENQEYSLLSLEEARKKAEIGAILGAVKHCHNNMSQAAKALGVSRVTLYRLVDKYQLNQLIEPNSIN